VALAAAGIDDSLAAYSGSTPELAMINFGANDVNSLPAENTWKTNYLYLVDAIHTKWEGIKIYLMYPWERDEDVDCATLKQWINDILPTREFLYAGADESVFLENGDDGATYTADGTHPNGQGYDLTAQKWVEVTLP